MSHDDLIDEPTVRKFFAAYHGYAAAALSHLHRPDVVQLCTLVPDAKRMCTQSFSVGAVDDMTEAALIAARAGLNVYAEGRSVRPGLPGERGKIERTVAIFSFTIDRDCDTSRLGRAINGDASIVIETSADTGNTHEWLFLRRALDPAEAKPLGELIRKASGADHCTGNFVQPYRVPGCPCFVDSRKAARGRTTTATRLLRITDELWTPERITTAFSIAVAKPRPAKKAAGASNTGARIPRKLVAVKKKLAAEITADMDRSAQFQSAINAAVRGNMAPDQFEELARQYPNGCAGKYLEGTDRLRAEIDRSYVKAQQPAEPVAPAPQHLPCTLADVHAVFRKWFGSEFDTDTVDAVMAAAAAQRLAGDPLWLLVVSGPGNAKTETVQSLSGAGALITSTIASEGALLSALPPSSPNATGGLLRKIGDHGLLVIKDVTSILAADRNTRAGVLAALREVYDGRWERNVGIGGGQSMGWTGRITIIGAVTSAWDVAHSVVTVMGDRFVLIRSNSNVGRTRSGIQAIRNTGGETAMRQEIPQSAESLATSIPTPTSSAITRLSGW